jgi:hypothetical protein
MAPHNGQTTLARAPNHSTRGSAVAIAGLTMTWARFAVVEHLRTMSRFEQQQNRSGHAVMGQEATGRAASRTHAEELRIGRNQEGPGLRRFAVARQTGECRGGPVIEEVFATHRRQFSHWMRQNLCEA